MDWEVHSNDPNILAFCRNSILDQPLLAYSMFTRCYPISANGADWWSDCDLNDEQSFDMTILFILHQLRLLSDGDNSSYTERIRTQIIATITVNGVNQMSMIVTS